MGGYIGYFGLYIEYFGPIDFWRKVGYFGGEKKTFSITRSHTQPTQEVEGCAGPSQRKQRPCGCVTWAGRAAGQGRRGRVGALED